LAKEKNDLHLTLKMMLFTFAGSSHYKYATYTLEMICTLELESSPALKDGMLMNWLVNTEGLPGKFVEGDLHQEHYNGELDETRDHNDAEWDGNLMRNVCSRNVHHFLRLKKEWGQGLGLAKKGGNHTEPHAKPEVRKLMEKYRNEELHLFRSGRQYDNADVDDFSRGYTKLRGGALQKWITETTTTRGLINELELLAENNTNDDEDQDAADNEETEMTPGRCYMHDGELVIETEGLDDERDETQDDDSTAMNVDESEDETDDETDKFAEVEFDDGDSEDDDDNA
jgi:hypothetical protein